LKNDATRNINFHINHYEGFENIDIFLKKTIIKILYIILKSFRVFLTTGKMPGPKGSKWNPVFGTWEIHLKRA